jgi:hypothetical protein
MVCPRVSMTTIGRFDDVKTESVGDAASSRGDTRRASPTGILEIPVMKERQGWIIGGLPTVRHESGDTLESSAKSSLKSGCFSM